jgi:hypothetical protein
VRRRCEITSGRRPRDRIRRYDVILIGRSADAWWQVERRVRVLELLEESLAATEMERRARSEHAVDEISRSWAEHTILARSWQRTDLNRVIVGSHSGETAGEWGWAGERPEKRSEGHAARRGGRQAKVAGAERRNSVDAERRPHTRPSPTSHAVSFRAEAQAPREQLSQDNAARA